MTLIQQVLVFFGCICLVFGVLEVRVTWKRFGDLLQSDWYSFSAWVILAVVMFGLSLL